MIVATPTLRGNAFHEIRLEVGHDDRVDLDHWVDVINNTLDAHEERLFELENPLDEEETTGDALRELRGRLWDLVHTLKHHESFVGDKNRGRAYRYAASQLQNILDN